MTHYFLLRGLLPSIPILLWRGRSVVFVDLDGGNFLGSLVLAVKSAATILCLLDHVEIVDVIEACRSLLNLLNSIFHTFVLLPDNFSLSYVRITIISEFVH